MKNHLPVGYYVLGLNGDVLTIGMDHGHMPKECVKEIIYDEITYRWGPLNIVRSGYPDFIAIVRDYIAMTEKGGQTCLQL